MGRNAATCTVAYYISQCYPAFPLRIQVVKLPRRNKCWTAHSSMVEYAVRYWDSDATCWLERDNSWTGLASDRMIVGNHHWKSCMEIMPGVMPESCLYKVILRLYVCRARISMDSLGESVQSIPRRCLSKIIKRSLFDSRASLVSVYVQL
jgi:hypothetical protein